MLTKSIQSVFLIGLVVVLLSGFALWALGPDDFSATVDVVRGYFGDTIRGTVGKYKIARAKAVRQINLLEREVERLAALEAKNEVAADMLAEDKLPTLLAVQDAMRQGLLDLADMLEAGDSVERNGRTYTVVDLESLAGVAEERYKAILEQIASVNVAIKVRRENAERAYRGRFQALFARQVLLSRLPTMDAQIDTLLIMASSGVSEEGTSTVVESAVKTFDEIHNDIVTQGLILAELRQMRLASAPTVIGDITNSARDAVAAQLRTLAASQ